MAAVSPAAERADRFALPALVLGSIFIGASPIFVRLSELGPLATAFHRVLWALPPLYLWMVLSRRGVAAAPVLPPADWARLALCGLLFAGDLTFWHWSILRTTVANATLFANFSPIIVTLGAWLILKEKIGRGFILGMLLALVGAGMLVGSSFELGRDHVIGDLFGLITALFFGSYMIGIASLRSQLGTATIMFWSSLVTCLALLPIAWAGGESLMPQSFKGLAVLIGLAWVSQAAGQGLIAYALGHLPAAFSSLVILIEPLTAAVLGWVLLAEYLGPLQAAGAAVVLAGIVVARRATQTRMTAT